MSENPVREKEVGAFISEDGRLGYLPGVKAAVITTDSKDVVPYTDKDPVSITIKGKTEMPKVVYWGDTNDFPQQLILKVDKSPVMSANLLFNITASFGEGVVPVVMIPEGKNKVLIPLFNFEVYIAGLIDKASDSVKAVYQKIKTEVEACQAEIEKFFEDNDIDGYTMESLSDLHWFFNIFPELILNKDDGDKWKIVELRNKEAAFSRWSEMDDNGNFQYHYYYGKWGKKTPNEDKEVCIATPVIDYYSPVRDLRKRMEPDKGKKFKDRQNSYILPVSFPTPGRSYYQKPYWYSLIESGWYDFAIMIPELKKNIITNESVINYVIEIDKNYFTDIFQIEKITDEKKQIERVKKEYGIWNDFLTKKENTNKSIVTFTRDGMDGKPYPKITIKAIDNNIKSGEYLEDSEEVSNIMCYAMLVHPSLVGAAPGKNSTISGSEARELFLIKQAILKPIVNRVLRPFYVIKAINKWSKYIHFTIPTIELTTLDKNKTGVQTSLDKQNGNN